jgi:hypothetical protein
MKRREFFLKSFLGIAGIGLLLGLAIFMGIALIFYFFVFRSK